MNNVSAIGCIGKEILYASSWYECVGAQQMAGAWFVEIYDEPPSKHIDLINISSIQGVREKQNNMKI